MKKIGEGGYAVVLSAYDRENSRHVAIKVLIDTSALEIIRFDREADVIRRLSHPNIVRLFSFERFADIPVLLLEYLDGKSLSRHLLTLTNMIDGAPPRSCLGE